MITPDLKQWRKTLTVGSTVLLVRRTNGRICEWRHTTITRIWEGRPSVSALGPTTWASLLPVEMEAQIEAEDKARRDAQLAAWDAREAAINAQWEAGADVVLCGDGSYLVRPGFRPRGVTGFKVMP